VEERDLVSFDWYWIGEGVSRREKGFVTKIE
jgi:hypothetical protein